MTLIHLLPLISFHFRCHDGHFFLSCTLWIVYAYVASLTFYYCTVYMYIWRDMYNHKNTFLFLLHIHLSQSSSFRLSETAAKRCGISTSIRVAEREMVRAQRLAPRARRGAQRRTSKRRASAVAYGAPEVTPPSSLRAGAEADAKGSAWIERVVAASDGVGDGGAGDALTPLNDKCRLLLRNVGLPTRREEVRIHVLNTFVCEKCHNAPFPSRV